ncbi:MAG: acetyltransferase [Lentimicrobium sp.]|jgi:sugar O-acyltransferase (sialic acid O-acetyltransferase NeuD family)|nr:acetyltransferase [Lentimicrobium sp.]
MENKQIILVGGGGHCISVIESLERSGKYTIKGISDVREKIGQRLLGYDIRWADDQLSAMISDDVEFLITIGHIKSPQIRKRLFEELWALKVRFFTLIDTHAVVSPRAVIGDGTVILRNAFVNAGAVIGLNCIINSGAMIEHGSTVGDHVHISTGAIVNGDCKVGNGCFVGSGAIISNGVSICDDTLISAGSVVFRDINTPGTYMGNPVRFVK